MIPPRKKNPATQRASSPLDRKQEALRAKEEQLKTAAAELQRLIDEAPRLREEQTRRRRQTLASDTRLTNRSRRRIYQHNASIAADPAMMQERRSQSRRGDVAKFILLSLALVGLIVWVAKLAMTNLGM